MSDHNGGFVSLGPCFQTGVLTLDVGGTNYAATDSCNTQTDTSTLTTGPIAAGESVTRSSVDDRAARSRSRSGIRLTLRATRRARSSS